MSEKPKQHWRFLVGKFPTTCRIFLNDEQWFNVRRFKIEAGFNDEGHPMVTQLTLQLYPDEVEVELDPSVQGDMDDGFFGERRANGRAHQGL